METIASFAFYGYDYTVFRANIIFKVKRTSRRTGKSQWAYTGESEIFDDCDDKELNDLLEICNDRIFLAKVIRRHRASKKAISALFTAKDRKTSHSVSNEVQT